MTYDFNDPDGQAVAPVFPMEAAPARAHNAEVDAAREMAEMQAQVIMAMKNPRSRHQCVTELIEDCKRYSLAKEALFSYTRGGKAISDGSIKLALVMAQNWGNLDYGVRELERRDGASVAESFCWDLQKNVRQRRRFVVPHQMKANNAIKTLSDPRDIYELVANLGARRLRSCIFDVIPSDVKRAAIDQVMRTLAAGPVDKDGKPLQTMADRQTNIVRAFLQVGVSLELLEKRLGHKIELTTGEEMVELQAIYNTLKEGGKRSDFFDFKDDEPTGGAADLAAKIHGEPK